MQNLDTQRAARVGFSFGGLSATEAILRLLEAQTGVDGDGLEVPPRGAKCGSPGTEKSSTPPLSPS